MGGPGGPSPTCDVYFYISPVQTISNRDKPVSQSGKYSEKDRKGDLKAIKVDFVRALLVR